ncbi:MAG TPA: YfhO family protein, partial [Acidobacteriota bacterium]|nr:YfhO family protein [Acidobacteriota bacterium]
STAGSYRYEGIAVESLDANRLAARVEAARRGVLVWSRAYNDAYRVFVDGRPASAYLVEAQLLGVPVEEGRHEVVVEWSPAPLRAGLAVGLLALAALAALRFGRRRGPSPRDADERPARVE